MTKEKMNLRKIKKEIRNDPLSRIEILDISIETIYLLFLPASKKTINISRQKGKTINFLRTIVNEVIYEDVSVYHENLLF
jgi:hypothetical protein